MKRILIVLLALCLLTACGVQDTPETQPRKDPVSVKAPTDAIPQPTETQPEETQGDSAPVNNREYTFSLGGVTLTPGTDFKADQLPEAESFYQIPSCAFEGTDNVYNYGTCEVIAYSEGKGEKIYSVYLLDPNTTTPEGLALGDEEARITALYGTNCTVSDGQYTYLGKTTQLVVLTADGFIISIEVKMNT